MLSSSLLGSKPTRETHGKKLIFSTFSVMEKHNKTCFQLRSCSQLTSWEMQIKPTQAQRQQHGPNQNSKMMELFIFIPSTGIQVILKSYAMEKESNSKHITSMSQANGLN